MDAPRWICLTHGELSPVPYIRIRTYAVTIDDTTTSGAWTKESTIYIPIAIQGQEREELLRDLLQESDELERSDAD